MDRHFIYCLLLLPVTLLLWESCSRPSSKAVQKQDSKPLTKSSPAQTTRRVIAEKDDLSAKSGHSALLAQENRVDLNSASEFELEALPGITPADAEAIIENRPYGTPEDLLTERIIPEDTYEKIKNRAVAN